MVCAPELIKTFTVLGMNVHLMALALEKFMGKAIWTVAEKHSNVYCMGGNE